VVEGVNKLNTV